MEISSNASSGKRPQSGSSQFSFSNDMQEGSAFDLLLSLPIAPSPTVEFNSAEEPVYESASDGYTCQSCEKSTEQDKETQSSEESESNTDETNQTDIASSVAAIDTIVAQQSQPTEQPIRSGESEVASPVDLPKSEATQPPPDAIGNQAEEATSPDRPGLSAEPDSANGSQVVEAEDDSNVQGAQSQLVQAASDTQQNQQQNSDDGQPRQPIQAAQQKPAEDVQELSNQTDEVIANPQTSSVDVDTSAEELTSNKTMPEPVKRGQQRERSSRWYEREAGETLAAESVADKLQATDKEKASPVELAKQVDADQPSGLAANLAAKDNAAEAEAEAIQSATLTAESTSGLTSGVSTGSTGGSTTGAAVVNAANVATESSSSSEVKQTVAPGLERVIGKSTPSNAGPLESAQTGTQVDISRAEKVRLVQRVARSFSRVGPSGGSVQLRLHPPELGALAMQIRIEGKDVTARLTTETQAAREVIMESLPQLRSRLAEQGYDVVQFTVDVASDSSSLGDQSSGQNGAGQGSSSESSTRQSPFELRRSSYLRRQLDLAQSSNGPQWTSRIGSGKGIDIQA